LLFNLAKAAVFRNSSLALLYAFALRLKVFVEEQGIAADAELDCYEDIAEHFLLWQDGLPAGTGRWRAEEDAAKLERLCVLPEYRCQGAGAAIVRAMEERAAALGYKKTKLHGQCQAAGFYLRLGYKAASEEFSEDTIPHKLFVKDLYI
jgi:predicted GNAT family N-acyltransferase